MALVAVCGLALGTHDAASAPDASAAAPAPPTHAAPDKTEAQAADMKAVLQRARDAVNTAKKAEDLDPILFDLQKYQNNGFQFGMGPTVAADNQQLLQQIFSAIEFTKQWQNYLSHLASGQAQQAHNDLQMLSQNNSDIGFMPRSKILALLSGQPSPAAGNSSMPAPGLSEASKIIDGITTLDDLQPALSKLNDLAADDPVARQDAQHLAPMVEVYGDLKNGLPTSVNLDFMGGMQGPGISVKANSLLLKFVLQHYFDTYNGAPPADNETPAAYATRVKNDALAGQDWRLLKRALEVHGWFYRNVARRAVQDDDSDGIEQMIAGLNQNQAGQYALAVQSFQKALESGSLDIPAKFIGAQLDAIKREHATEYNAGMEAFLSPPQPLPMTSPDTQSAPYVDVYRGGQLHRHYLNAQVNPSDNSPSPLLTFPGTNTNAAPQPAAVTPAPPSVPAATNAAPAVK